MNVKWTYYNRHVVIIMWPTSISYFTSLPFTNPLPWPHGILKCPSFQNLARIIRRSSWYFYDYCEFRHATFYHILFLPTI